MRKQIPAITTSSPRIRKGIDDTPNGWTDWTKADYGPDERLFPKEPDTAFTPQPGLLRKWMESVKIGADE